MKGRSPKDARDAVVLDAETPLTLEMVVDVARGERAVTLAASTRQKVAASHDALLAHVRAGAAIYGLTTGVGALEVIAVAPEENRAHQLALLRSHAAGVGSPMDTATVRAMVLTRLAALCRGQSGVRVQLVEAMARFLSSAVVPHIPELGSVGAADLSPLAHLGLVLAGEGRASIDGEEMPSAEALRLAGLSPHEFEDREALALMNAPAQTVASGALSIEAVTRLVETAEQVIALDAVALGALSSSFDPRVTHEKPHPGSLTSAAHLRSLLDEGAQTTPPDARATASTAGAPAEPLLREVTSMRVAHHVVGALRDAARSARAVLERELASAPDNPIIGHDGFLTSNAANFDGHAMAVAFDAVTSALIALAASAERRTARLLDPAHNRGLPAFLVHPEASPGRSSGLMIAQYTAAALVAELRMTSALTGGQTIPTSAGTEDLVSMSAHAARQLARALEHTTTVLGIELLVSAQAFDLRTNRALRKEPATDSPAGATGPMAGLASEVRDLYDALRAVVPTTIEDRVLADDIAHARRVVSQR